MKSQLLALLLCSFFSLTTVFSQTNYLQNIHFESDKYDITENNKTIIESFVSKLNRHGYSEITIVGHTDQDGTNKYNQRLSQQRAEAVKKLLESVGFNEDLISVEWKGEMELVDNNNSKTSKKLNRRVTLLGKAFDFKNTKDLLSSTDQSKPSRFLISNNVQESVECTNGTTVNVPADAFEFEDGSLLGDSKVEIEVIEAFTYTDFITQGLFTHSKNDILETGGMIYVNATADGKALRLKEGQTLEIVYPVQEVKKDMELFFANYDENNEIDWEETSQRFASTTVGTSAYDFDIDWDVLLNFDFQEVIKRPNLYFPEMASKPSLGYKPFPPSKPLKPTLENTTLQLNTIDKVLKGRKKKALLKQEKYKKALLAYDEAIIKYEQNYKDYLINLENYSEAIPHIKEAQTNWYKEVDRRIGAVANYKRDMKKFHVYAQIKGATKKIRKEIGKRSNKELLNMFNGMMQSPINLSLNERKLFRKVFGNQTKRILDEKKIYPKDIDFYHEYNKNVFPFVANIIELTKKKALEEEFAETGKIDNGDFGRYLTNISQLGWINCDKFRYFSEKMLADIYLKDNDNDVKYYLIFTDMKSMLPAKRMDDKSAYVIYNMPKNKNVKIVGVKLNDNEPQLSVIDYKIGNDNYIAMDFSPASLKDIRTELNNLD